MAHHSRSNTARAESNYLDVDRAATSLCRAVQERSLSQVRTIIERRNFPVEAIVLPCESLQQDDGERRTLTALHYAVESTDENTLSILSILIDRIPRGYRVNANGEEVPGLEVEGTAQIKRRVVHHGNEAFEYSSELYTSLCWACLFANFTAVGKLIQAGANVNSTASEGGTTALMAIGSRTSPDYQLDHATEERKIVNILLRAGASLDIQDDDGNTALHFMLQKASHFDGFHQWILQISKTGQIHVNCNGWNVLHCCAFYIPQVTAIRKIVRVIRHNTTIPLDQTTKVGHTAYTLAEKAGNQHIALELQSYESPEGRSFRAFPPQTERASNNQNGASMPNGGRSSSTSTSTSTPRVRGSVQIYPEGKTRNLSVDETRKATLALAAAGFQLGSRNFKWPDAMVWAAKEGYEAVVQLLLEHGAAIDAADGNGDTALYIAARNGHEAVVGLLLEYGAGIEATSYDGYRPIHAAAVSGHEAVVELLLGKGAAVDSRSKMGWTALHGAAGNGHEAVIELLLGKGAAVESRSKMGWTALHQAAANGHEAVVELLLGRGAAVDSRTEYGVRPIHLAAHDGHWGVIELLLERGAAIEARSQDGKTALHIAAYRGYLAVVKLLLKNKASTDAKAGNGGTALDLAIENDHKSVVLLLRGR
jgi:ankyrin repeat protein